MKKTALIILSAMALVLAACNRQEKTAFPVYGWQGINENTDFDKLRDDFKFWKSQGFVGVCIENSNPELVAKAAALAHQEGLEYHAWIPCMLRGDKPHDWYAVNRLGQPADEFPAYVPYYKALDPRHPQVHKMLVDQMTEIAKIPEEFRCDPYEVSPSGDPFYADKRNVEAVRKACEAAHSKDAVFVKIDDIHSFIESL